MTAATQAPLPRVWGFWATLGWLVLSEAAGQAAGRGTLYLGTGALAGAFGYDPRYLLAIIALNIAAATVILIAIRLSRVGLIDYCALVWPDARRFAVGLACFATFTLASVALGIDEFAPRTVGRFWPHLLGMLVAIVIAPIEEEAVYRGFVLRGFLKSPVGAIGAIVISAALFAFAHMVNEFAAALMHLDEGLAVLRHFSGRGFLSGFTFGVMVGWVRWYTGSSLATIPLHAIGNGIPDLLALLVWLGLLR